MCIKTGILEYLASQRPDQFHFPRVRLGELPMTEDPADSGFEIVSQWTLAHSYYGKKVSSLSAFS